jgi:NAD(P)-dependent dehydrogenase (short-subunit alcohol dehydrogenase family)
LESVLAKNELALVTGGAQNIGAAICRRLSEDGYGVILLDIAEPDHGDYRAFHQVDLADATAARSVLAELAEEYEITRLVNNVGIVKPAAVEAATVADFEAVLNTNARSAVISVQALLPAMRARGFGRIVSTASRVVLGKELRTSYSASKGALVAMTRTWALELAGQGITVNCVAPGPIATSAFWTNNPPDSARAKAIVGNIPVGRIGTPEDVSHAVSFLLDDRSSFVTGQVLYVCGGLTVGLSGA